MKYEEFLRLSNEDQHISWMALSVEIARFQNMKFYFFLYQLADFYIQLKILKSNRKEISFEAFSDTNKLDPYLQTIDITTLCTF